MRRRRSGNEQAKRKSGHGFDRTGHMEAKGKKRKNEQKRLHGKRWRWWLWWRGWMRKTKQNNKNRRKETKENQKRKKMEEQAKATTNDRNKKT